MATKPSTSKLPSHSPGGGAGGAAAAGGTDATVGATGTGGAIFAPTMVRANDSDAGAGQLPRPSRDNHSNGAGGADGRLPPPTRHGERGHQGNTARSGASQDTRATPTLAMVEEIAPGPAPRPSRDGRDVTPSGVLIPPLQRPHGKTHVDQVQDPQAPPPLRQPTAALAIHQQDRNDAPAGSARSRATSRSS